MSKKKPESPVEEYIEPSSLDGSVAGVVLSYLQSINDQSTWQQVKESYSHEELRVLINTSLKYYRKQS